MDCVGEYGTEGRSVDMSGTSWYSSSSGIQSAYSALASFTLDVAEAYPSQAKMNDDFSNVFAIHPNEQSL